MSKSITPLLSRRTVERLRPERHRQELAQGRGEPDAFGPAQVHPYRRGRELGELLATAAARRARLGAFRHDYDLDYLTSVAANHSPDRGRLRQPSPPLPHLLDFSA